MTEYALAENGELDLGIPASPARASQASGRARAAAGPGSGAAETETEPAWGDWVDDGWIPGDVGDPENDPADDEAWLAALPADVRADYLAGAWTGDRELIPAGFLHHLRSGPYGAGFAAGGALDTMVPGPWLAEALSTGTAAGHAELGESELIGVLCAWRRMSSWAAAGEAAAAIALARRRAAQAARDGKKYLDEHVNDELAAALTLTGRSADRLLSLASGLDRLADVHAALERGHIDWAKACVFVGELAILADDDLARGIASRLLNRAGAGGWTTGQLRAALRRAVLAADPQASDRRRTEARRDAEVQFWDEPSGNAALAGRELPPADAVAADSRLTALARWLQDRGASGTVSQLRAAVYSALLAGRPVESLLPGLTADSGRGSAEDGAADGLAAFSRPGDADNAWSWPQVSGTIHLTMPLSAWLGGGEPGEVAGRGPVDAQASRELAAMLAAGSGTSWCLTLTGSDGLAVAHACAAQGPEPGEPALSWAAGLRAKLKLLEADPCSHGRESACYQPPSTLRHLIMMRQRTCSFPGCRQAVRCDLDHTVPFDQGGRTCECNLSPLCRRHHRAKQAPGWRLQQLRPGEMTWQLPSGRRYEAAGEPYAT